LLVEYRGCDRELLDDKSFVERIMRRAVVVAGATEVGTIFRNFSPQGVTGVVVVEESHLSIHTWPEYGYAAVDFYTCGDCAPERADAFLREQLQCESAEVLVVQRGIEPPRRSLEVVEHRPCDILASTHR
jgi:S-adenosylmethionine decarboxylase proenzyme